MPRQWNTGEGCGWHSFVKLILLTVPTAVGWRDREMWGLSNDYITRKFCLDNYLL